MKLIDTVKNLPMSGFAGGGKTIKKAASAAWWLLTKSPKLFRRGFQLALIYGASLGAEKLLDKAHAEFPDNNLIGKADTIIRATVNAEDFLIGGAVSMAKSVYEAVPAKAEPARADTGLSTQEHGLSSPGETPLRQATFLPVQPSNRNRANVNGVLVTPLQKGPTETARGSAMELPHPSLRPGP